MMVWPGLVQGLRQDMARVPLAGIESEEALQDQVERALRDRQAPTKREVCLTKQDRIDFLVECGIGIEVKIDGSLTQLTRQLHRYAQSERIFELVVVTSRSKLVCLPDEINGKPVHAIYCMGAVF